VYRADPAGVMLLPGLLLLLGAPLLPDNPQADRSQRAKLERELAGYSTPAERADLEALLDGYPDGITHVLVQPYSVVQILMIMNKPFVMSGCLMAAQLTPFQAIRIP
jgi:hypothetical protein